MTNSPYESLSQKYERILSLCEVGHRVGIYTQIRCPIISAHKHEDKTMSASLGLHDNGISFKCFAGCQTDDFLKALGLTYADMFPSNEKIPTNIYTYHNSDGSYHHDKLKYPRKPDGSKDFRQRTIDEKGVISWSAKSGIPFGYPQLIKAIASDKSILYCEGEKDALTAKVLGHESTTMGGASDWKDEYKSFFKNARLILVPDKDDAGLKLTSKMIDSLKTVCKSLKTLVLPQGKDLTEWVEAGNHDIKALGTSQELVNSTTPIPTMVKSLSGYIFTWHEYNITIKVDRLNSETECELSIYQHDDLIHIGRMKLLSTVNINSVVKLLGIKKSIDWQGLLNQLVYLVLQSLRQGAPIENMDDEPLTNKVEYLIYPILPLNQPTTIFAPGGSGKSTLVDYIAVLAQFGIFPTSNIPFQVRQANVLYLDWEDNINNHRMKIRAIKRAMGINDKTMIRYQKCEHSLADIIDDVRKIVSEHDIELVIIDSQMAATADSPHGMTDAQIANEYYNNLRSLNCTTLTIDHVTKNAMSNGNGDGNGAVSPYGSVVKYNRSRCQFELKVEQETESDTLTWALIQRKNNLGKILQPIGMSVHYVYGEDNLLDQIHFTNACLSESPTLNKTLPKMTRIQDAIRELGGQATIKDIATQIGEPENYRNVGIILANKKKYFVKIGEGTYGLAV